MHGPRIKASLSYYVTRFICAAVNQFDYINKKELIYTFDLRYNPHRYQFYWMVKDGVFRYGCDTGLAKLLNTYVSPWLRVKNES